MNRLLLLLTLTITLPFTGNSQLVVSQNNFGIFHELVTFMSADVSALFQEHGVNQYSEFVFTTDFFTTGEFITDGSAFNSLGEDFFFVEVSNPGSFIANGTFEIGFFGNESWDRNKLSLNTSDETTDLFEYGRDAAHSITPAPTSYAVTPSGGNPVEFFFSHTNPVKGVSTQESSARFKFFQQFDPYENLWLSSFIIAIDDREDSLVDHDDGFFFFTGDSITPVPEPSAIAAMAIIGLIGVVYFRRRKCTK